MGSSVEHSGRHSGDRSGGIGRIAVLDAADGFAILRVVFFHALANYWIIGRGIAFDVSNLSVPARIPVILLQFSVPVFLLVSGFKWALSAERHPERTYGAYILRRFRRLGVPFLIWTGVYYFSIPVIDPMLRGLEVFRGWPYPGERMALKILTGGIHPAYQLWFIPMILSVNIAYPPLKRLMPSHWVSLPFFGAVYLLISHLHVGHPLDYARYFIFQDIGVAAHHFYRRRNDSGGLFLRVGLLCALPAAGLSVLRVLKGDFTGYLDLKIWLELVVPAAIFFIFLGSKPGRFGRIWIFFGRRAWRLFILHAPLVLFNIGWMMYQICHRTNPLMFLVTGGVSIFVSLVVSWLIDRMKLGRILF